MVLFVRNNIIIDQYYIKIGNYYGKSFIVSAFEKTDPAAC